MPWWDRVTQAFESAADLVRDFLGIGSSVEPIPGFETDPDSGGEVVGDESASVPVDERPGDQGVEYDEYISSGSDVQDWESDPDDEGWPGDDELKYSSDVDKEHVRGYFGSRAEAWEYAGDIPVTTEVWYDPDVGAWWVEVTYETG